MQQWNESETVCGLLAGDPEAWTALYQHFSESIWRQVARLIGNRPSDVEDIVQETFLAAARSATNYDPDRGDLQSWLAGIARHQVGNYFRNRKRDARLDVGGDLRPAVVARIAAWLDGRAMSPDKITESSEVAAIVRTVLANINDDYRSLLIARYHDEMSAEQIAVQQATSAGAVRSKLVRARAAFRAEIVRHGYVDEGKTS